VLLAPFYFYIPLKSLILQMIPSRSYNEQILDETLKQFWGYDHFRDQQKEIIQSVLSSNDTLALLPTGGGKSLCYQLPSFFRRHNNGNISTSGFNERTGP
jgi:superfamily II DNA helicase RecQ